MNLRRTIGRVVAPPLIAGILAIHLDGCAGTVSPPRVVTDPRTAGDYRFYPVAVGTTIEITRRDGVLLRGRFLGTARMPDEEYARHSGDAVFPAGADSSARPTPGDSVEIRPWRGEPISARLAGFSLAGIELAGDSASIVTVAFTDLKEVRTERWSRTGMELARNAIAGRLPLSTLIRVGVADGEVPVLADQIAVVHVPAAPASGGGDAGAIVAGVLIATVAGALLAVFIVTHLFDDSCGGFQTVATTSRLDAVLRENALALADPAPSVPSGGRP